MHKTDIEIVTFKRKLYSKNCPFNINYTDPISEIQHIRKVGSTLCRECDYFEKVEGSTVHCREVE